MYLLEKSQCKEKFFKLFEIEISIYSNIYIGVIMGKTFRIWRKKPNPERLHFFWNFPIYREEKKRISCIHKSHRIRNEWWKTLRHYNKSLCKRSGMRWKLKQMQTG